MGRRVQFNTIFSENAIKILWRNARKATTEGCQKEKRNKKFLFFALCLWEGKLFWFVMIFLQLPLSLWWDKTCCPKREWGCCFIARAAWSAGPVVNARVGLQGSATSPWLGSWRTLLSLRSADLRQHLHAEKLGGIWGHSAHLPLALKLLLGSGFTHRLQIAES